ncbi:hypothetical protein AB0I10_31385 [Streptomyces sp. NPDC050636]|uniref:hypothetical protein n=1 Tax=Streptomyces sp. NPDC050636 TaxID=3154510 RepID=UPI00341B4045
MPESADRQEIRIRITGTDNPHQDIEDLKAWLEREPWLRHQGHDWTVRPAPADATHGTDETDLGDMAVGVDDLILVIVGAVAAELTKSLSIALREWLRRRREERAEGEEPAVVVIGDAGRPGEAPQAPDPGGPADEGGSTRQG